MKFLVWKPATDSKRPGWIPLSLPFLLLLFAGRLLGQQPLAPQATGNHRRTLRAVRTAEPITLDGALSEAAWQDVSAAGNFAQAEPYEGEAATEPTEVKILYDQENLYIGVYCHDSEPNKIVVSSLKEDFPANDTDTFEIILDTFQDSRNGFLFLTNPEGAKRDAQITDEGRNVNADWDTVWDVRAQRNGDGWTAEMVIPFKSLSLDERPGEQVWGVNFARRLRRKNEIDFWSPVPRRYDISHLSLAGALTGLEEIERGRNLRIKPFVVGDLSKFARNDSLDADLDGGLDVKYNLTPSLTLDLTFNTDFSQVEVDEQQINLTRFPLFFPEKREFFLENAGIFQFGDVPGERGPSRSKETQLFFSRRIGLSPDGDPIPIWGGARLSGQAGKFSLGLLNLETKAVEDNPETASVDESRPANNFAVVRVKRNILANSDIGALFVNRQAAEGGDFNRTYGADGNFRFGQNFTLNGFLAKTKTDGLYGRDRAEKVSAQYRDNFFRAQWIYTNQQENFNPEVGFIQRQGVRWVRTRIDARPRPGRNPVFREFDPHFQYTYYLDQTNRTVTKEGHYAVDIIFQNGSHIELEYDPYFDHLEKPFQVRRDLAIPAGDYRYTQFVINAEYDPSRTLSGAFDLTQGGYYSGTVTAVTATATLRPNYRFSAQGRYTRNAVRLPEVAFVSHLFSTRISYSFSTRLFLNALIQYNSDRQQVTSNIRFNFIHRPLSDLFLVYNELRDVSAAHRNDRAATVKYTHMISF